MSQTRVISKHVIEHDDGHEFELRYSPADHLDGLPLVRRVADFWVVGYLVRDTDCDSPLESSDGMGTIYTTHRHAGLVSHHGYQEARGLDQNWRRDKSRKPNPMAVLLDVYDHSGQVYAVSGSQAARMFPDQQWDVAHGGAVWVPDDCCEETIRYNTLKAFLPEEVSIRYRSEKPYGENGKGFLNRVMVDIRVGDSLKAVQAWESRTRKTEMPEVVTLYPRGYKSFWHAAQAALRFFGVKPDSAEVQMRLHHEATRMVEGIVEEYNKWLCGDCWGVCVEVIGTEKEETCWGFVGEEYAREELQQCMDVVCDTLSSESSGTEV